MLYFYSATYSMLFNSLIYSRNATYKYLPCMANNNIQIYFIYNQISLINMCLNYNCYNEFNSKDPNGPIRKYSLHGVWRTRCVLPGTAKPKTEPAPAFSIKKYRFPIPPLRSLLSQRACVFRGRLHRTACLPLSFLARGTLGAVTTTAGDRTHLPSRREPRSSSSVPAQPLAGSA
jgi:hypothetical protein